MVSFFARHEKNKSFDPKHRGTPWNDKGYVAWLLWGGDAGKSWANKISRQMEAAENKMSKSEPLNETVYGHEDLLAMLKSAFSSVGGQ